MDGGSRDESVTATIEATTFDPAPGPQITLLLTDVEGSTRLGSRRPRRRVVVRAAHDDVVARLVDIHGGRLVRSRSEGDSAFVVFDDARTAVDCALAMQIEMATMSSPSGRPLRVRMGIHTGHPHHRGDQLYGPMVNRTGAVRNLGHGGQVLISAATLAALNGAATTEFVIDDLGEHRLKGLNDREQIHQASRAGLPSEFPPLRSPDVQRHNLPTDLARFVGPPQRIDDVTASSAHSDWSLSPDRAAWARRGARPRSGHTHRRESRHAARRRLVRRSGRDDRPGHGDRGVRCGVRHPRATGTRADRRPSPTTSARSSSSSSSTTANTSSTPSPRSSQRCSAKATG